MFEEARRLHGHIDIVCANAGINDREDILRDDLEEPKWDVTEVNLKGVLKSTFPCCIRLTVKPSR